MSGISGMWSPIVIHTLISTCPSPPFPLFSPTKGSVLHILGLHLSAQPPRSQTLGEMRTWEQDHIHSQSFLIQGISKDLIANQSKEPQSWLCSLSAVCIFYIMHGPGAPMVGSAGYNHNQSIPTYFQDLPAIGTTSRAIGAHPPTPHFHYLKTGERMQKYLMKGSGWPSDRLAQDSRLRLSEGH